MKDKRRKEKVKNYKLSILCILVADAQIEEQVQKEVIVPCG